MLFIKHRVNTTKKLQEVKQEYGVEIDIRYHNNDLILCHDPFHDNVKNELFEDYLQNYQCDLLILNLKTEGIEDRCIQLMNKYSIKNWAFLDMSMPYFVKYTNKAYKNEIQGFGVENLIVRFSEFEPIEYALSFRNKVGWVWVDCFAKFPLNYDNFKQLSDVGFKIIIVSPELQNHDIGVIQEFKNIIKKENINIDAICTKRIDLWNSL